MLEQLQKLLSLLQAQFNQLLLVPRVHLFIVAKQCLGIDLTTVASNEFGCMESVDRVHFRAFGRYIGNSLNTSTREGYKILSESPRFMLVSTPLPGDIIISPTGQGHSASMTSGHIGIVGINNQVMSNSSATGLFTQNYTLQTWADRYVKDGGYPVYYFRIK